MKTEVTIDRFLYLLELGYDTKSAYTQLVNGIIDFDTQKRLAELQKKIDQPIYHFTSGDKDVLDITSLADKERRYAYLNWKFGPGGTCELA